MYIVNEQVASGSKLTLQEVLDQHMICQLLDERLRDVLVGLVDEYPYTAITKFHNTDQVVNRLRIWLRQGYGIQKNVVLQGYYLQAPTVATHMWEDTDVIRLGNLLYHRNEHRILNSATGVELGSLHAHERHILRELMQSPGVSISGTELITMVQRKTGEKISMEMVRTTIENLRRRFGRDSNGLKVSSRAGGTTNHFRITEY